MALDFDVTELVDTFLAECEEGLAAAEEALVRLEGEAADLEAVATAFRVTHTIKGNAASLGYPSVSSLAHAMEDVLHEVRQGSAAPGASLVKLLLQGVDRLREMIPAAARGEALAEGAEQDLIARLHAALRPRARKATPRPAPVPPPPPVPAPPGPVAPERRHGESRRREDHERELSLRVDRDKLDRLLNLTGEIAIAQGRLEQLLSGPGLSSALEAQREVQRLFTDLQEQVMKARMVPLGPVFHRHVRTVHDAAAGLHKQARLQISGEDVEVDTSVVELVRDPLTHMVRNAVDHGLETPQRRIAAGKDPCGTIALSAEHDAGSIVITLGDDGAGLDREALLARARKLGLLGAEAEPPDTELFRLIFEPGFSTASVVTELSGRGVGLDVVRRNVEALRGSVAVHSEPGRGTTLSLRLPLTLAIIPGLQVEAAGDVYVVPLDSVVECVAMPEADRLQAERTGTVALRGHCVPYLRLGHFLGQQQRLPDREEVVVVRRGEGLAGLAVDRVLGECQTVIKPLGRLFQGLPGVSGATILGTGRVALILDAGTLIAQEGERQEEPVA